jgi:hypothetical protein
MQMGACSGAGADADVCSAQLRLFRDVSVQSRDGRALLGVVVRALVARQLFVWYAYTPHTQTPSRLGILGWCRYC